MAAGRLSCTGRTGLAARPGRRRGGVSPAAAARSDLCPIR
jgi:hypothetical protein